MNRLADLIIIVCLMLTMATSAWWVGATIEGMLR